MTSTLILGVAIVAYFVIPTLQQRTFFSYYCISDAGNYTHDSEYQMNLNTVLSSLETNSSSSLFSETSAGQSLETSVYGRYYCRHDVSLRQCASCIQTATKQIIFGCPSFKQAVVWFEQCTLIYLNSSSSLDALDSTTPYYILYSSGFDNVTNPAELSPVLEATMNLLINKSAYGTGSEGFATAEAPLPQLETLYSLVQCSPDRVGLVCERCLKMAMIMLGSCCNGSSSELEFFYPHCQLRYSIFAPFYVVSSQPPGSTIGPPFVVLDPGQSGKSATYYVTRVAVPMALAMLLVAGVCVWQRKKLLIKGINQEETGNVHGAMTEEHKLEGQGAEKFTFQAMKNATRSFSDANKLGQGGFGAVYKGKLQNGEEVAIKRLSKESRQGNKEFSTEVLIVAKLQHRNLVRLLGYCEEKKERLLVYEYVPNLSLDQLLFDPSKSNNLDWRTRYNIIFGIGRGLQYLHHESRLNIVHRDLKTSNILLDGDMNPKIADFGLAKLITLDHTHGDTTKVAGTLGYMAPEYIFQGQFSTKADVYSFGVILLEIVSGQKICRPSQSEHNEGLLQRAWRYWEEGNFEELLDPILAKDATEVVNRCIQIALLCVQQEASTRPPMQMVLNWLNNNLVNIPSPVRPAALAFDTTSPTTIGYSSSNVIEFTEIE